MHLLSYAALLLFVIAVSDTAYSSQVIEIGAVEGQVIDETTQAPLSNAGVLMTWELRVLTFPQARSGGYVYVAYASTDLEGKFRLAPSNAIDLSQSTQDVELGDVHVWLLLEGFKTRIDKVSYRLKKKGIPFFNRTIHATVDEELVVSLKQSAGGRTEFFDIGRLLSVGDFSDDKNACNDPMFGEFIYKAVKRQSQLRNHVGDIPEHLFKQIDCTGDKFSFYPYSG